MISHPRTLRRAILWAVVCCSLALGLLPGAVAAADDSQAVELAANLERIREMSLEQLMSVEVTTVAGTPQQWFATPAAITVLTADDLRRAGVRTLPEALRLVPGMFVGRQEGHFWRIGPRGFTGTIVPAPSNLVMIDGRSVYDPLFGGVFWDVQDLVLENIDRIEVIRGPGATLWGPNAVNGVINVITRSARATPGTLVHGGGGTYERAFGGFRSGFSVGENAWLRLSAKGAAHDSFDGPNGGPHDDWTMFSGNARLDAVMKNTTVEAQVGGFGSPHLGTKRTFAVPDQNLVYETLLGEDTVSGGYALARVARDAEASGWAVQSYYQHAVRDRLGGLRLDRSIADIDARWHRDWSRHELLVGTGYRYSTDDTEPGRDFTLSPASRTTHLVSGFAQWTATLQPELRFMLGSKVTWHTFTEWEPHPSARLWWTPTRTQTAWAAISRPVRSPTRVDRDGMFIFGIVDSAGTFVPTGLRGSEAVDSEWLWAYEAGYRIQPRTNLTFDVALYFNDYHDLISIPSVPGTFNNAGEGESYGVELASTVRPYEFWDVTAGYAFTEVEHTGPIITFEDRNAPKHIAYARSALELTNAWEFDTVVYYVDDISLYEIPSYTRLDCGLSWRARSGFEAAVWGHNLLRPGIRELGADFPRGVWAEGKLRF